MSPKGAKILPVESIINLTEFSLIILRTDSKTITNPYIKAKAVELITIFIYADQKKELTGAYLGSEIIVSKLMETLIAFYVDIEFAG